MSSDFRLELEPGQTLFREGDGPTTAFLIERGTLRITADRNGVAVVLSDLGAGALVGEMAVLDDSPRSATATAIDHCVLTPVDRDQFAERLAVADPVVRALLLSQVSRYRHALATFTGGVAPPTSKEAAPSAGAAQANEKIRLESQLREALSQGNLDVLLQPIMHIGSGKIAGYEALTRWNHPERGAVSPAEFIALAEETSLIIPVGDFVLDAVCAALRRFSDCKAPAKPFVALNVSGRQLDDPEFVERVIAQTRVHEIDPAQLKIEITESLILDYAQVDALIQRCHRANIRVALDDFGTGYSNLGHLHKMHFDTLKLDQGFVRQLDDARCIAVVRAVVGMAAALGCDMVAEGVETEQQLAHLRALGCQYAQGYLIGRPQSVDAAIAAIC